MPFIVSGALCAVLALGCKDDSQLLTGTWVRTKTVSSDTDVWTLKFRDDGTFSMRHEHFENGVSADTVYGSAREGEYWIDDAGRISLSGGWMDGVGEVGSLSEVAAAYKTFSQKAMYMTDGTGTALFIGPDFNLDSAYTAGDSYDLLFESGQNAYARESSLVMTDASGAVVEQRDEAYTYTFIDDEQCTIEYSFTTVAPTATGQGVVAAESCSYEYSEGAEVVGLDGATAALPIIKFEYTLDGESRTDNFVVFDGVLISYTQSLLSGVLAGNAFVKLND
jgi:hypothetical protein